MLQKDLVGIRNQSWQVDLHCSSLLLVWTCVQSQFQRVLRLFIVSQLHKKETKHCILWERFNSFQSWNRQNYRSCPYQRSCITVFDRSPEVPMWKKWLYCFATCGLWIFLRDLAQLARLRNFSTKWVKAIDDTMAIKGSLWWFIIYIVRFIQLCSIWTGIEMWYCLSIYFAGNIISSFFAGGFCSASLPWWHHTQYVGISYPKNW